MSKLVVTLLETGTGMKGGGKIVIDTNCGLGR